MRSYLISAAAMLVAAGVSGSALADCETTVGVVLELTGPAGPYGQAGSKGIEMAFADINKAGGAAGCKLVADVRDDQTQANVAVDAANQLVQVKHVPALIGGIISSTTIAMLTSVTAPAKVVQISVAASSPTLTALGQQGKTNGIFFRAITSDALQSVAAAKFAVDQGLKKVSVIDVNNDFGVNMVAEFSKYYKALGGTIVSVTPYNEKQASYQAEVTKAMEGGPDALYLISYPVDGATIARAWISQGGPKKFLLNDGMNSADFIKAVGAQYLDDAYGTSSGSVTTASTDYFDKNFKAFSNIDPSAPGAYQAYDAGAIVGLAIAQAGKAESAAIRDAIYKVTDPKGEVIHAGPDEFKKALDLIKAGKPIRYEGTIGPISFDQYGDITGPFRLWRVQKGEVTTLGEVSAAQVDEMKAKLAK